MDYDLKKLFTTQSFDEILSFVVNVDTVKLAIDQCPKGAFSTSDKKWVKEQKKKRVEKKSDQSDAIENME